MPTRAATPRASPRRANPVVTRLRRICLALPEAREKLSHGEPAWFAGAGKMFATLDDHHHGAPHLSVWLPQPLGAQEVLVAADPQRFFRPPYVGPSGWVGVVLDTRPDWGEVERLVRDAYATVARPRLRALLAGEAAARRRRADPSTARRATSSGRGELRPRRSAGTGPRASAARGPARPRR